MPKIPIESVAVQSGKTIKWGTVHRGVNTYPGHSTNKYIQVQILLSARAKSKEKGGRERGKLYNNNQQAERKLLLTLKVWLLANNN